MPPALSKSRLIAFRQLPVEAFPDVQDVQVQIITPYPSAAPEEVERMISRPIEAEMSGVPRITQLRSVSMTGLSVVTLLFSDGTDDYFARQQVLEKLQNVSLPPGTTSQLAPLTTAVGERHDSPTGEPEQAQFGYTYPSMSSAWGGALAGFAQAQAGTLRASASLSVTQVPTSPNLYTYQSMATAAQDVKLVGHASGVQRLVVVLGLVERTGLGDLRHEMFMDGGILVLELDLRAALPVVHAEGEDAVVARALEALVEHLLVEILGLLRRPIVEDSHAAFAVAHLRPDHQ